MLRNIYGRFLVREAQTFNIIEEVSAQNLFKVQHYKVGEPGINSIMLSEPSSSQVYFDASRVVNTGTEVKPYTILAVPIYIF